MATTAAPYGLRPVKRVDGMPYAGATNQYLIDPAGYNTNLFYGAAVFVNSSGYINLITGTGADATTNDWPTGSSSGMTGAIGVFVGASYINAQGQQMYGQYYPANTTGVVTAYVVDDPMVLFQAQLNNTATQAAVGRNTFFAAAQSTSTGSTQNGNSTSALSASTVTTTAAFRILGFASPVSDAYPDVLVKINPAWHSMSVNAGL
jgi:hypothetical protein